MGIPRTKPHHQLDESPRDEFFYYGEHDLFALRYNNWKVHFQTKDDDHTIS